MSSIGKRLEKILEIAKCTNESDFQKNDNYLKLKSMKLKSSHSQDILNFVDELRKLNFIDECIYWNKKTLKIVDMCDKSYRQDMYGNLVDLFAIKKNYEMVLKYGNEALKDLKGTDLGGIQYLRKQNFEHFGPPTYP